VKIALDAMGGDLAPKANVEGAVAAARDFGIEVVLVGNQAVLEKELAECGGGKLPISIVHASETVEMSDSPIESVLSKPNSSMHVGYEMLKRGEADGFLSAGNSGAMMTVAIVVLGNLPGVDRPAIASMVPSSGEGTVLIDAGANVEVKPFNLVEFAVMGAAYARNVRKIARPRVGILSNGEEDSKGSDLTRAAAATLRAMAPDINYIGYVEGRDINRGSVDVVVTDGFTGNVALKTMEGFASFILGSLRELFDTGFRGRFAYLLMRKRLRAMRERFDPSEYGGAPLLGVNGVVIMAHGSSNARAIRNAIRSAADESFVRQVNAEIVEMLRKIPVAPGQVVKPAGKGLRALLHRMRERLQRHPKEGEGPVKKPPTGALEAAHAEALPHESSAPPSRGTGSIAATGSLAVAANGSKPAVDAAHDHPPDHQQDHPPDHQSIRHDVEAPASAQNEPVAETDPAPANPPKH
jgi:phosphate acyltransferase